MRFDSSFLNIKNAESVINSIKLFDLSDTDDFVYKNVEKKTYYIYKSIKRLSPIQFKDYINKKRLKEQDIKIQEQNKLIKTKNEVIKQKNNEIQNLRNQNNIQDQAIKRLQNSWSYRIGRLFTYPLSIPLELYKYIRDYNLIKNSGLFDCEYYLSQNEDVKKARVDPIKHYLKFGWKEGRNPSAEFNGNEYLNTRPDVRSADICPLVHYLKYGRK